MLIRSAVVVLLTGVSCLAGDWNPRLAAQFLDAREKDWFAWKTAASPDGPCVSCHTGLTYLLARPMLRHRLGETEPTVWETGLLDRLRSHAGEKRPGILQGVESTFTALFLAREELRAGQPPSKQPPPSMSAQTRRAFDQMWALQTQAGDPGGGIRWYSAKLDPWETPEAFKWGSALAAMAVGTAPVAYREEPETRSHIRALTDYLQADFNKQPLHHRLGILWASSRLPEVLPQVARESLIRDVLEKQKEDGGWSMDALGPWDEHPAASPATGSSAYATGYTAYILQTAGVAPTHPTMKRALAWLRSNQNAESGAWAGRSMNKIYPEGSMEAGFVQDAATAFASMALLQAGQ